MSSPRLYDMVFLVVPEKDEQGAAAVVESFRKLLLEQGATMQKDESMGRRRLAYEIHKKREATYHNFMFNAEPKAVNEVERRLRLSEDVLRFLTVRVDLEMRHGQKVARNTKVRVPRRVDGAPDMPAAPAPAPAPAAEMPAAE